MWPPRPSGALGALPLAKAALKTRNAGNTLAIQATSNLMMGVALDARLGDSRDSMRHGRRAMIACKTDTCTAIIRTGHKGKQLACNIFIAEDDVQLPIAVHIAQGDRIGFVVADVEIFCSKMAASVALQELVGLMLVADDNIQVAVAVHVSQGYCDRGVLAAICEIPCDKITASVAVQELVELTAVANDDIQVAIAIHVPNGDRLRVSGIAFEVACVEIAMSIAY